MPRVSASQIDGGHAVLAYPDYFRGRVTTVRTSDAAKAPAKNPVLPPGQTRPPSARNGMDTAALMRRVRVSITGGEAIRRWGPEMPPNHYMIG